MPLKGVMRGRCVRARGTSAGAWPGKRGPHCTHRSAGQRHRVPHDVLGRREAVYRRADWRRLVTGRTRRTECAM